MENKRYYRGENEIIDVPIIYVSYKGGSEVVLVERIFSEAGLQSPVVPRSLDELEGILNDTRGQERVILANTRMFCHLRRRFFEYADIQKVLGQAADDRTHLLLLNGHAKQPKTKAYEAFRTFRSVTRRSSLANPKLLRRYLMRILR